MSIPASAQPVNSRCNFPVWKSVRTLYVEMTRVLKVDKRQLSEPEAVMKSVVDCRPAALRRFRSCLVVFEVK